MSDQRWSSCCTLLRMANTMITRKTWWLRVVDFVQHASIFADGIYQYRTARFVVDEEDGPEWVSYWKRRAFYTKISIIYSLYMVMTPESFLPAKANHQKPCCCCLHIKRLPGTRYIQGYVIRHPEPKNFRQTAFLSFSIFPPCFLSLHGKKVSFWEGDRKYHPPSSPGGPSTTSSTSARFAQAFGRSFSALFTLHYCTWFTSSSR